MPELISPEVECLKLKAAINENHRLAQTSMGDALERMILIGELLGKWKELLPHGKFEPFTETHFDGSLRTAQLYMKVSKGLSSLPKAQRIALLGTEDSLTGLVSRLKKDDSTQGSARDRRIPAGKSASSFMGERDTVTRGSSVRSGAVTTAAPGEALGDSISEKGRPGGGLSRSSSAWLAVRRRRRASAPEPGEAADSSGEENETGSEPQETDPRPPRSGKERKSAPVDYGKCPACAGNRWKESDGGMVCAKCGQHHGEPAGQTDENRIVDARSKAVKTCEAMMRAVDDLNLLLPKAGTHKQVIELCKSILKSSQNWK